MRAKKEDGEEYAPLTLQPTKFLPSLGGVCWNDKNQFTPEQKIAFKREKLNFTIIKETTENDTSKYEMFQRLNTGGTHLSAQEIRNCLMIMINKPLYELMNELHNDVNFKECTPLTDTQAEERYDLELVVKYLLYIAFASEYMEQIDKSRSMDVFLTEELEKYAQNQSNPLIDESKENFPRIFALLNDTLGKNVFKRYQNGNFKGSVMLAAFESIVPGLFLNIDYWELHKDELTEHIKQIYDQEAFVAATRRGTRALDRMSQLIRFSRVWFAHENKKLEKLQDLLDQEIAWRKKELIDIKLLIHSTQNPMLCRAGIALLSAHFEGFIRPCLKMAE